MRVTKAFRAITGDWAGSDDDGNNNVKAEHRLAKLSKQRLGMVRYYLDHYEILEAEGHVFAVARVQQLRNMAYALETISKEIHGEPYVRPDGDIIIPLAKIPAYSEDIGRICVAVTGKTYTDFVAELEDEASQEFLKKSVVNGSMLLRLVNDLIK